MKKLKSTLLVLLMAVISLIIYYMVIAITGSNSDSKDDDKNTKPQEEITENQSVNNIDEKVTISLVAVGDNFAHESVIESGKNDDGTYNYDFLFEGIKDEIMSADISAIYQTMIIAGNDKGLSGYPLFNTPEEMMSAIQNTGFDIALMASNHTTDMGVDGIKSCIELWKKYAGVLPVGINESGESSVNIPIIEVKGKRVAILNYTYGLNKPITSTSDQYMVNYLGALNSATGEASQTTLSEAVLSDIQRASDQADFVVVFPCWGDEYTFETGTVEKKWAKQMTEAGANLIIGAHTHYIGEVEQITADNGNTSMCYYSLGNFCSSFNNPSTMVGALAKVNIVFEGDNVYVDTETSGVIPIVTHYTHSGNADDEMANIVGIYPISEYTSDMAASHGIITRGNVQFSMDIINDIINTNIKPEYILTE
ncbi:MAG: CapA family protein [Lachnospiraceae bacterium]|nr:CapA family protein [Lachnospiraceae bacterium]